MLEELGLSCSICMHLLKRFSLLGWQEGTGHESCCEGKQGSSDGQQGFRDRFWSREVSGSVWVTQIGAETSRWAAGRGEGGAEGELNLTLPQSSPI